MFRNILILYYYNFKRKRKFHPHAKFSQMGKLGLIINKFTEVRPGSNKFTEVPKNLNANIVYLVLILNVYVNVQFLIS